MRVSLILFAFICIAVSVSGCTRFNELSAYEGDGKESVIVDESARAQNAKDAGDPRPYGGIFGEGFTE